MLEALLAGFEAALRVDTFIWMSAGLLLGMLMGAMPGFTTTMGMSVLMPIAFLVGDPLIGIPFLIGVYKGGIYGGEVAAPVFREIAEHSLIYLNIPRDNTGNVLLVSR